MAVSFTDRRDQLREHPRTRQNNFWHKLGYPWQVWLDGLNMALSLLAHYSLEHEGCESLTDIHTQFTNVRQLMFDEEKALSFHGYDESRQATWADSETGLSACLWSRAIGWYVMALVDLVDLLPEDHPDRAFYAGLLAEVAEGVAAWQPPDGMWMQVMDQPERPRNYPETSTTAMFAYAFLKGVRLGVLEPRYEGCGRRAFDGIVERYLRPRADGMKLGGICLMAGLGDLDGRFGFRDGSFDYYVGEPVVENDPKGVGPFMMAHAELLLQG